MYNEPTCSLSLANFIDRCTGGRPFMGDRPDPEKSSVFYRAGDTISFTTRGGTRVESGRVMEVDLLAQLPIRVEYHTSAGDKRIERFHPDEFKSFKKEQ